MASVKEKRRIQGLVKIGRGFDAEFEWMDFGEEEVVEDNGEWFRAGYDQIIEPQGSSVEPHDGFSTRYRFA